MDRLEDLLKALLKNGLKIFPKKCQLFRTNLQHMANEIFIQNERVCVQPLRSRLEVIQKLQPPSTVKGHRSLVGMVNFLSMFCPELQKLLKPIYDLTRRGTPFLFWEKNNRTLLKNLFIAILEEGSLFCEKYKYRSLKYELWKYPACISLISIRK